MSTLIIARHGNTFAPGEPPRRVGAGTDLPLVDTGLAQGIVLGNALAKLDLIPSKIFCSELQRTQQTAEQACLAMDITVPITTDCRFNEIDYGVDENKTEDAVIARIGREAIQTWDAYNQVPPGWQVEPDAIKAHWQSFANEIIQQHPDETIMVVTSNGIARFAPCLLANESEFDAKYTRKIATGAFCELAFKQAWSVRRWNQRPHDIASP